jgi:hypothetical protein
VEPAAGVTAVGRGGRAGERARCGIDGGFAGLAVFGVLEAGLASAVAWAVGHRRPGLAALAAVGGAAVAGSGASYLYSTGLGKRAIWAQLLDDLGLQGDERILGLFEEDGYLTVNDQRSSRAERAMPIWAISLCLAFLPWRSS